MFGARFFLPRAGRNDFQVPPPGIAMIIGQRMVGFRCARISRLWDQMICRSKATTHGEETESIRFHNTQSQHTLLLGNIFTVYTNHVF
jgi:hypothetical protein